jgi:cell division protein ZapA
MDKTSDSAVTNIKILGRDYPIRSRLDSDDVSRLGSYVREKMESVANRAPRRDLVHVAVLAALNIADDYFRSLDGRADDERHVLDRMLAIEAMVDRAVDGARPGPEGTEPPALATDHAAPEPPEAPEPPTDRID